MILDPPKPEVARSVHAIRFAFITALCALCALGAALLFGAGTPAAKLLLGPVSPWLLAGLLYLGSGLGLALKGFLQRLSRYACSAQKLAGLRAPSRRGASPARCCSCGAFCTYPHPLRRCC